MKNNDKMFNEFDIDLETADKIAKEYPSLSDSARERMFNMTINKMNITNTANEEDIDSVHGVEKYNRPRWIKFAGMAAAFAIVAGAIGGESYLLHKMKNTDPNPSASVTDVTTTSAVTTNVTTTVAVAETTKENNKFSVTKEELIEKANDNSVKYFDKFSAEYTVILNELREFHTEPETRTGKVYLDEVEMTASGTEENFVNDKLIKRSLFAVKDGQEINGDECWTETDYVNGGYKFLETPIRNYDTKPFTDNTIISKIPIGRNIAIDVNAPDNWEITGERTENGRKIVSISGVQKGDNNYEGVYREYTYTGEIDAATGITISYDVCDSAGNKSYSYKMTNYKFDEDAVVFNSASDIINEIENGGFTKLGSDGKEAEEIYTGSWICGRAIIEISYESEGLYQAKVSWSSSAAAHVIWDYPLTLDNGKLVCNGNGKKTFVEFKEGETEATETVEYTDGSAEFTIDGGHLFWNNFNEHDADNMIFEKNSEAY